MSAVLEKLTEMQITQAQILENQKHQQELLGKHAELLTTQGETLLRNTITVEEHKEMSINLRKELARVENRFSPVEKTVDRAKTVAKFITWVAVTCTGLIAAAAGIYEILSYYRK